MITKSAQITGLDQQWSFPSYDSVACYVIANDLHESCSVSLTYTETALLALDLISDEHIICITMSPKTSYFYW